MSMYENMFLILHINHVYVLLHKIDLLDNSYNIYNLQYAKMILMDTASQIICFM